MRTKLLTLAFIALAACGSASPSSSQSAATASSSSAPTPTPTPLLQSPAIVQVENSQFGRPQSGLGSADVVYEYVAEGGIGRFSLMFFHLPAATQLVGPVRSARTVTVQLTNFYHAFLVYSGASTYITGLIHSASFPSFDETGAQGNLFRVNFRDAPHNLYTDGSHLGKLASAAGRGPAGYKLWDRTTHPPLSGTPVTSFVANISQWEQPMFRWDATAGAFTRTEDTGLVKDGQSGKTLEVPTVIVQQVSVTTDPNVVDVNGVHGVDQGIKGSGAAQVFTAGRMYNATWKQSDSGGPPQFTLADGSPAPISPGEVWICLVATGQAAAVTTPAPTPTPSPSSSP